MADPVTPLPRASITINTPKHTLDPEGNIVPAEVRSPVQIRGVYTLSHREDAYVKCWIDHPNKTTYDDGGPTQKPTPWSSSIEAPLTGGATAYLYARLTDGMGGQLAQTGPVHIKII